jgi:hypothetical protein
MLKALIENLSDREGYKLEHNIQSIKDMLFRSLGRLSDSNIKGAELCSEISRSEAIVNVVSQLNSTADTMFKAAKTLHEIDAKNPAISKMLLEAVGVDSNEGSPQNKKINATAVGVEAK